MLRKLELAYHYDGYDVHEPIWPLTF